MTLILPPHLRELPEGQRLIVCKPRIHRVRPRWNPALSNGDPGSLFRVLELLAEGVTCGIVTAQPTGDPGSGAIHLDNNVLYHRIITASDAATLVEIGYFRDAATNNPSKDIDFGLYASDATPEPTDLLFSTGAQTDSGGDDTWFGVTGLSWSVSGSTDYWLAAVTADNNTFTQWEATDVANGHVFELATQVLSDPAGALSGADADGAIGLYCVIEAAGGIDTVPPLTMAPMQAA